MAGRQLPNPAPTTDAVRRSMQGNRAINTKPELELRRLLRDAGYPGYRLHWSKAPGRPDIAYPGRKLAIFVNGCFWHRCPHCNAAAPKSNPEFWERKFELNRERDARKTVELEAAGWTAITVWECQIKSSPREAIAPVLTALTGAKC